MRNYHAWLIALFICFGMCAGALARAEAGIVMKVVAVNPSKAEKQHVPVKAYLPKEIKPDDILNKGDLDIAYDNQQGSYYVYGEYELNPTEVLEREIEMRDIWAIPAAEIESLQTEADRTAKILENTDFKERMGFLKQSIENRLKEIMDRQKVPAVNPERHISDFRDNQRQLELVKADLAVARSLLAQAKPIPPASVWKLILIIVLFLGVLGISSYFIWQMQSRVVNAPTFDSPEAQSSASAVIAPKQDTDKGPLSSGGDDDVEKIIRET